MPWERRTRGGASRGRVRGSDTRVGEEERPSARQAEREGMAAGRQAERERPAQMEGMAAGGHGGRKVWRREGMAAEEGLAYARVRPTRVPRASSRQCGARRPENAETKTRPSVPPGTCRPMMTTTRYTARGMCQYQKKHQVVLVVASAAAMAKRKVCCCVRGHSSRLLLPRHVRARMQTACMLCVPPLRASRSPAPSRSSAASP